MPDTNPAKKPTPPTEQDELAVTAVERIFVEQSDTFLEEANILRIEGRLFSFNPVKARQQSVVQFKDSRGHYFEIEFHPNYGQPSVLAYRLVQAVFKKLTNDGPALTADGLSFVNKISFSERELGRMVGRSSWGRTTSREIKYALRSIRLSDIRGSFYDKGSKMWFTVEFSLFPHVMFAQRQDGVITSCLISIAEPVIKSLNHRHWVCFNWDRNALCRSEIAMAVNKRLFYHFSNLYGQELERLKKQGRLTELDVRRVRKVLVFRKSYTAICDEWLGGLTPLPYQSRIKQKHGVHFDDVKRARTVRSWKPEKRKNGDGFNLVFHPGMGFFADYEKYYQQDWQPKLRFQQESDRLVIEQPIEAVTYFYCKLHNTSVIDTDTLSTNDTELAAKLLDKYGVDGVHDLIDYAIAERNDGGFKIEQFRGLKVQVQAWLAKRDHREQARQKQFAEAEKKRQEELELAYDRFRREAITEVRVKLPVGELNKLKDQAAKQHRGKYPDPNPMDQRMIDLQLDKLIEEHHPIVSMEDWLKQQAQQS